MKQIKEKIFEREGFVIFLVVALSLLSVYQLLLPGFYEPQDLHHLADIYEMARALVSGQLPPRWGPDFLYGFGYPLFNFYYPGPFYLGAFVYFLSGNLRLSYEAVFEISAVVGSVGFYIFLRNHFSKMAALPASVLFIFTPYKAVEIFVRGAMGEFLSLALFPWILFFTEKYIDSRKRKWFVLLGAAAFLTIISHNYFWVLIFIFCGLYFLLRGCFDKNYHYLKSFVVAAVFSLLASAYWWSPALIEQKLLITQTPFPLIDHFPFVKQLFLPFWGYGASVWGPNDGMSFQLGVVNVVSVLLAILVILLLKNKNRQAIYIWSLLSFVLCLFFMNSRSYFIWNLVPFYNLFQFPWRLLAFAGFFSSLCAALTIEVLRDNKKRLLSSLVFCLIIVSSTALTINYFKPSRIFYKSDTDYLQRMFTSQPFTKNASVSEDYINYSEDYLLLPKWVAQKPNVTYKGKFASKDESVKVLDIKKISEVSWQAEVEAADAGKIYFYSLYFPGWEASVDGHKAQIGYGDLGQIELNLPKGTKSVHVYWQETDLRKAADVISLLSLIAMSLYASGIKFFHRSNNR